MVVGTSVPVTRTAKSSLAGLQTGDTVVVQGTKASNGEVTATSVRATGQGCHGHAAVAVAGFFGGGGNGAGGGGGGHEQRRLAEQESYRPPALNRRAAGSPPGLWTAPTSMRKPGRRHHRTDQSHHQAGAEA